MIYDEIESFRRIHIGDVVKIRKKYIPPCIRPVHSDFVAYMDENDNEFTINKLQLVNPSEVLISVFEIMGILEYFQIEPLISNGLIMIFNWRG